MNYRMYQSALRYNTASHLMTKLFSLLVAVKQRIQLYDSSYNGCRDCVHRVVREEGVRALYRSYATQLLMNVPFGAAYFTTYEATQDALNPQREYRPLTHILSGAVSGGFAAGITTPLDVCKTVLNTASSQGRPPCKLSASHTFCDPYIATRTDATRPHEPIQHSVGLTHAERAPPSSNRYAHTSTSAHTRPVQIRTHVVGLRQACAHVYATYGSAGFFRGAQARIVSQMPATAISWSVYEFFKWQLTKKSSPQTGVQLNASRDQPAR